jgi:hypothetical protein
MKLKLLKRGAQEGQLVLMILPRPGIIWGPDSTPRPERIRTVQLPRGHTIPLSPARRLMCDLMHASRRVPLVAMERRLALGEVVRARQALAVRPSWFAIFIKAYALVSEQLPPLRQAYLSFPYPRLHQHACTVGHLAVARKIGDEEVVLGLKISRPDRRSLADIDALIRRARTEPIERFGGFRRALRLARLPMPIRRLAWWAGLNVLANWRAKHFGTFGVTGVAALGAASLHLASPLTSTIAFGVIDADGSVMVRLFYDHRVMDGVGPATALAELEQAMCGPIAAELRSGMTRAA